MTEAHDVGEYVVLPKKAASNTEAAFRELIGGRVVGILRDALPLNRPDLSRGNTTLIMHDGSGFTFSSSGSYWREQAEDVQRAVVVMKKRLEDAQQTYEAVLELAGLTGSDVRPGPTESNRTNGGSDA